MSRVKLSSWWRASREGSACSAGRSLMARAHSSTSFHPDCANLAMLSKVRGPEYRRIFLPPFSKKSSVGKACTAYSFIIDR